MASSEELRSLRAMANRRHRAATRKISRLKTDVGVNVSGTNVDPRRNRANIKNYTEKQLRSYIRQLDTFTSRKTQYVPDAHRRPVPATRWREYQRLEKQYNAKVQERFANYRDIHLTPSGMTIGQRMEFITPSKFPHMQDRAVNTPYTPLNRKPTSIGSGRALDQLIKEMKNRVSERYFEGQLSAGREQFKEMMELLDDPGLARKVSALSDEQFEALWNYTQFPTALSLGYDQAKNLLAGTEKPWSGQALEQSMSVANELASWAGTIDLG